MTAKCTLIPPPSDYVSDVKDYFYTNMFNKISDECSKNQGYTEMTKYSFKNCVFEDQKAQNRCLYLYSRNAADYNGCSSEEQRNCDMCDLFDPQNDYIFYKNCFLPPDSPENPDTTPSDKPHTPINWWLWGGIGAGSIILLIIVAILIYFIRKRFYKKSFNKTPKI